METVSKDTEDAIIEACKKHEEDNQGKRDYSACIFINDYFVKFRDSMALWPEIQTHMYIAAAFGESLADTSRPRIPKVVHYFERDDLTYMIQEKITLSHSPPDLPQRMLEAITWLATVPAPKGHVLGPLGGGHIRHSFFKDYMAPFHFQSVQDLEFYMNKARMRLSKQNPYRNVPICINSERLLFTQPDMHVSNFGVDEQGKTVLLDFGEIAFLPESFARFTLSSGGFGAIIESLGLSGKSNMAVMSHISYFLGMVGNPKLGIKEEDFPGAGRS